MLDIYQGQISHVMWQISWKCPFITIETNTFLHCYTFLNQVNLLIHIHAYSALKDDFNLGGPPFRCYPGVLLVPTLEMVCIRVYLEGIFWHGDVPPHVVQPCYVALGRALIFWGLFCSVFVFYFLWWIVKLGTQQSNSENI